MSQEGIISFQDVSKSFGDVQAVDGANFEIKRGEFFSLLVQLTLSDPNLLLQIIFMALHLLKILT